MSVVHATSSDSSVDPLLQSALSDLESEGVNLSDPANETTQDELNTGDTGTNPDVSSKAPDPAETGAAESETKAADAAQSDATPQSDDPLAGAQPFTYTVDGQPRTMEGVYRFPGEGLMIPEEQVPKWQLMASRAEGLERANRDQYQRLQDFEKLSEWTSKDQQGQEQTITGRAALEAREVTYAKTRAVAETLSAILEDPATIASLIGLDADGRVVKDEQAIQNLLVRAQLAAMTAEGQAKSRFATVAQEVTNAVQQAQQQEQLPATLWASAEQHWVKEFPSLTAQDKEFLAKQVPRYMRAATDAEVQSGSYQRGEMVLDGEFYHVIKFQADTRTSTVSTVKTADAAARFNAAQQQGRQGTQKPVTRPATPQKPTPSDHRGKSAAWDDVLKSGLAELGSL